MSSNIVFNRLDFDFFSELSSYGHFSVSELEPDWTISVSEHLNHGSGHQSQSAESGQSALSRVQINYSDKPPIFDLINGSKLFFLSVNHNK